MILDDILASALEDLVVYNRLLVSVRAYITCRRHGLLGRRRHGVNGLPGGPPHSFRAPTFLALLHGRGEPASTFARH